jgi:TPR repeat protein
MLMVMPMTVNAAYIAADKSYIDSLTRVAERGDAEAQISLGFEYYLQGNYTESAKWYRKAAEQGNAEAQVRLGDCYAEGEGVKQEYAEAAKWYHKAAEQGNTEAQVILGDCYAEGEGVKQDYTEAAKWFRKAADKGNEWAQRRLGLLYEEGEGVKQDYTEAAIWYRKAAEQGDSRAQNLLGDLYAQGTGVKQDYAEAAKWYRKAAEQGDAIAQISLGLCYATGKGVDQNINDAAHLIFKGLKDLFGLTKLCVIILILLLISIIITLFIYKKYRKEGFKKSQAVIISFISWLCLIILILFLAIGFLGGLTGPSLPDLGDFFKMTCVPLTLFIVFTFIIIILKTKWIISSKTNSISAEGENETLEDTLMDGKKGHKVKFNIVTLQILSFAAFALAILVGIPYYWFVTKALGHEPLSRLTGLMSSAFIEDAAYIIINLLIFLLALILGLVAMPLLHRLVWGWRNTSYRMDWKIMMLSTYCNKLLKKSQYIKGVIAPFFVLGLLPLLISPFISSIGMCLFGIVFISSTSSNFMYIWKLRKEPRNCMIMDIKGEHACFVLDEEQPADNE